MLSFNWTLYCTRNFVWHYLQPDDTIIICLFVILITQLFAHSARNGDLQTTTVFFTCNFTRGWVNSYYSLSAMSCPFMVLHKQSNECSWSRTLVFTLSRKLHRVYTLSFVHSHTCLCLFLSCLLLLLYLEQIRCIC